VSSIQTQTHPADFQFNSAAKKVLQLTFRHASGDPAKNKTFILDGESDFVISDLSNPKAAIHLDDP
jgi:hypothetical protein